MSKRSSTFLTLFSPMLVVCVALSQPAVAGSISVGDGSVLRLGDGVLSLGCDDLEIEPGGKLAGEAGSVELGGSWIRGGVFEAGSSMVHFEDFSCAPNQAMVNGDNTFFELLATSTNDKQLQFAAGAVQTVENHLGLEGSNGSLLEVRSTMIGQEAFLDLQPGGSQNIDYVDVQDNHAIGQLIAPGAPSDFNSIDSGNTVNWFVTALEIPSLSTWGLAVLSLLLAGIAVVLLRRHGAPAVRA